MENNWLNLMHLLKSDYDGEKNYKTLIKHKENFYTKINS